jgi:hypothetical protein
MVLDGDFSFTAAWVARVDYLWPDIIVNIFWFETHRQQPAIWQHILNSMLIGGDYGC